MRPRICLTPLRLLLLLFACGCGSGSTPAEELHSLQIATFSTDITIPIGHRCMGVLKTKSKRIDDPLEARGLVLLGSGAPVVLVALDWCEVRNASYDQWRDALATAAHTTRQRVLVCSLHQHDAPVVDAAAQDYLDSVGLQGELFDREFHARCLQQAALALEKSLTNAKPLTHIGSGQAKVSQIASNRRVVHADGSIHFDRYSRTSPLSYQAQAEEGEIDPLLKSITFYSGDTAVAVLSSYATHPMSHYGDGAVSADFVGLARRRRQTETLGTFQIYVSGCSGDVTAGKYNDGAPETRGILADRLYEAMKQASQRTDRHPVGQVDFHHQPFELPFHEGESLTRTSMTRVLHDGGASVEDRITAAMGLSSLDRVERGQPIDLPCVDFGDTKITLLPGEAFVKYQLISQQLRPDSFVMAIGYGECWPGYVPTDQAFQEGFGHGWRWVGPGCETIIRNKLDRVLGPE